MKQATLFQAWNIQNQRNTVEKESNKEQQQEMSIESEEFIPKNPNNSIGDMDIEGNYIQPQNWKKFWDECFQRKGKPNDHLLKIATWNANGSWQSSRIEAFKIMKE